MLAVKASYDNGVVRWVKKPRVSGFHNLVVVFDDVDEQDDQSSKVTASGQPPSDDDFKHLIFSLSCLENAYGNDEPDYTDDMLKTRNQEFTS